MGLQRLNNFFRIIQCFILSNIFKTKTIWRNVQQEKLHTHTHPPFNSNSFHSFISFNKPNNASRQEESVAGEAGGILFWDGLVPLAPSATTYSQPVGLVISAPSSLLQSPLEVGDGSPSLCGSLQPLTVAGINTQQGLAGWPCVLTGEAEPSRCASQSIGLQRHQPYSDWLHAKFHKPSFHITSLHMHYWLVIAFLINIFQNFWKLF